MVPFAAVYQLYRRGARWNEALVGRGEGDGTELEGAQVV